MNRFAGVASFRMQPTEREARLREALAPDGDPVEVIDISPFASVAHCGNAPLFGLFSDGTRSSALYGGCHAARSGLAAACSVDSPGTAATSLLQRHEREGQEFMRGVAGSFIGAITDSSNKLSLFSDPGGTRSLFLGDLDQGGLAFASHPLTCARILGCPTVDRSNEDFLLVYGFVPDGKTVYSGVRALATGTLMEWQPGTLPQVLPLGAYTADLAMKPQTVDEGTDLLGALHDLLIDCLRDQLPDDPDVGVLLGGFDSALVAALLHRLGKRVKTYSFRYDDENFNQPHTDTLAQFLGTEHRWIRITPEVIASGLRQYADMAPQPTNWLNYIIQTAHVCGRMRADGIRFAYSGDGCDAVFLGYPGTYQRTRIFARLPRLPSAATRLALAMLGRPSLDRWLGHPHRMALNLIRATQRPMPDRAFLTFRILDELSLDQLRLEPAPPQAESIDAILHRLAKPHAGTSIQRLGYLAKGLVSPNKAKLCASTDMSGVQIFSPYLHPRLKAFSLGIPDHMLREQGQSSLGDPGKICLMRMAQKYRLLPDAIIFQPKLAAIDSPIDAWFAGVLNAQLTELLAFLPFPTESQYLESLLKPTFAEIWYKKHIGSTRVLSDAASLLATYAAFQRAALA